MQFVKISLILELIWEKPYNAGWKASFGENIKKKAEKSQKEEFFIFGISRCKIGCSRRENSSEKIGWLSRYDSRREEDREVQVFRGRYSFHLNDNHN